MRAAKWTLIIVGTLLLLLVGTALVITSVIDPNRYRGAVESMLAKRVGKPVVIDGNLEITWFPWLGLRLGETHVGNQPGDAGPPIIEWQSLVVAAKVMPLLRGELVVDRVRVMGPQVRLRRDAEGRGNWEDLVGTGGAGGAAGSSGARQTMPLRIAGVEVRDGTLSYLDEASGLGVNLSHVSFDMGEWRAGQPLPVHAHFLAQTSSLPPAGIWLQVDTPALAVSSGSVEQVPSAADEVRGTQGLSVSAPTLSVKIGDAEARGNLSYSQAADGKATAQGAVTVHAPSLRKLVTQLGLNQTMPHDPATLGELELTASWSYANELLAAKPVVVKLDGITLNGWVERGAPPASGWRFQLHGDRIDLGRYVNVDSSQKKPFELDMLKAINANGSLSFDEAELADTHMSDVRLRFETPQTQQ